MILCPARIKVKRAGRILLFLLRRRRDRGRGAGARGHGERLRAGPGAHRRALERIAAEMKPIAESVSFDPFRLVEMDFAEEERW